MEYKGYAAGPIDFDPDSARGSGGGNTRRTNADGSVNACKRRQNSAPDSLFPLERKSCYARVSQGPVRLQTTRRAP